MANEITTTLRLRYAKNGITDQRTMSDTISAAGDDYVGGVQSIGTTEEAITMGEVSTAGVCRVMNIDATNYVELGAYTGGTFYPFVKLMPGEGWVFRLATSTPYAKANTGAVRLEYAIFEN